MHHPLPPPLCRRHVGVYSLLCQDQIVPNDLDIIDAFGGNFPDPKLADPAEDAKATVRKPEFLFVHFLS